MKLGSIAAAAAALLAASAASATTYLGSLTAGSSTATYSIVTDGTLGVLASANILSSSGSVTSASGSASFTNGNFNSIAGSGVTATATQLFFDFSQDSYLTIGNYAGTFTGFCLAGGGGFANCAGQSPVVFIAVRYPGDSEYVTGSGSVLVGATVPEPATWALLITGFGLTGAAMRRRNLAMVAA